MALVWDAAADLTVKLLDGHAFRAPSFSELYGINPVANGNANLRPETMHTTEIAFAWQARRDTQLNLDFFHYQMQDIIRAVANTQGGSSATFQNAGSQVGRGAELEAIWDPGHGLRLSGQYAYQHGIDRATNTDAGYAPRRHAYGRADWRTGKWLASTQVNWVADRKRAFGDTRPDIPNYTTVDLTLRTAGNRSAWEFAGSVRNLLNSDAREPSLVAAPLGNFPTSLIPDDLPLPRRSFYLQAIYKL
jgi:iron complex outermembrane receptor protein